MIYRASFVNPMDGEYDTLDTTKIDQIELLKNSIRSFDGETKEFYISYEFYSDEINHIVVLRARNADLNFSEVFTLDMQRFVDECSRAAQNKKLPDSTDYIQELKHRASSSLAKELLKNNKLALNAPYNHFGFIYSGSDKIGTFESMTIENRDTIFLDDVFSLVNLSNVDNISFETYFNGTSFTGTIEYKESEFRSTKANDGHRFELSNFENEKKEESNIPSVDPISSYDTNEDFINSRKALLDVDSQNESFSLDEFSDLF